MLEILRGIIDIGAPFNMVVLVVLIICIAGVIGGIAKEIRKYGCHRQDIEFKRELVDRGLSSEEIERIVGATPTEELVAVSGNGHKAPEPVRA